MAVKHRTVQSFSGLIRMQHQIMWFSFSHRLPEGVKNQRRKAAHGTPKTKKPIIAPIFNPPFYLLILDPTTMPIQMMKILIHI